MAQVSFAYFKRHKMPKANSQQTPQQVLLAQLPEADRLGC
jgi:hypothetical protein